MEGSQLIVKCLQAPLDPNSSEISAVHELRRLVFEKDVKGMEHLLNEKDDECFVYLGFLDDKPVGTARFRVTPEGYKLERMAVDPTIQGKGLGKRLLDQALYSDLYSKIKSGVKVPRPGLTDPQSRLVYMYSQAQVCGFYEKCGFKKIGEKFTEIGKDHYRMEIIPEKWVLE